MSDTSLISNQETPTTPATSEGDAATQTADQTPATDQVVDDKTAAEKLYPNTPEPGEKPAEGETELTDEQKAAKAAEEGKTNDELTDEEKAAKQAEEDAKKEKDKDDENKSKGEPLDLTDIEVELPEGMELNQEAMSTLGQVAGELGLDKEGAAKLVPIGVTLVEAAIEKQQAEYETTRQEWRDEVAADTEIGGADDATRNANLAIANKGLEAYGSPELRTLLNQTGLGDHKEVIRVFHKLGKMVGDDVIENGGSGDTGPNPLDKMYPSMAKNK